MKRVFGCFVVAMFMAGPVLAGGQCCELAKAKNGWCTHCGVGFAYGVQMGSQKLHDELKPTPVTDEPKCAECSTAIKTNGVCPTCHYGYIGKMRFRSLHAYHLARGEVVDAGKVQCEGCKKALADNGWCDHCKVGFVSGRMFKDKTAYDEAVKSHKVLLAAAEATKKCELCGIAMAMDGTCIQCKIKYKDGEKVEK